MIYVFTFGHMSSVIILKVTPCFSYSFSGSDKLVIMRRGWLNVYNLTTFCLYVPDRCLNETVLLWCVVMCDTVQLVSHACSSTWLLWQRMSEKCLTID